MMAVLVLLTSMVVCGTCLLFMLVFAAVNKAAQKQQMQNQQQPPIVQPAEELGPPPREVKDPQAGKAAVEDRQPKKIAKEPPPGRSRSRPLAEERRCGAKGQESPARGTRPGRAEKERRRTPPAIAKNAPVPAQPKGKPQQQQQHRLPRLNRRLSTASQSSHSLSPWSTRGSASSVSSPADGRFSGRSSILWATRTIGIISTTGMTESSGTSRNDSRKYQLHNRLRSRIIIPALPEVSPPCRSR